MIRKIRELLTKSLFTKGFYFISGIQKSFTDEDALKGLVFACLDAIASKVATVEFVLKRKKDDEIVEEHPILEILKKPNPYLTEYQWKYLTVFYLGLYGRALYWIKEGLTKSRKFLYPITLNLNKIDLKDGKLVYVATINNELKTLSDEEVLDLKRPHPFDPLRGLSVLEQARFEVEGDLQSLLVFRKFMEQGAIPSGLLVSKEGLPPDDYEKLRKEIEKRYSSVENFFRPLLLIGGVDWKNVSIPLKDLQFIEQRKFTRDQILAIFRVPKAVLFADDVNRANAEAAKYWFSEYTIKPYLDIIVDSLQNDFIEKLGYKDIYLDYKNPVPEDKEHELKRLYTLTDKVITRNEARAELGLDPVEGGDTLYFPNGLPVGSVEKEKGVVKEKALITNTEREFIDKRNRVLGREEKRAKERVMLIYYDLLKDIGNHKQKKYETPQEIIIELMPYFDKFEETLALELGKVKVKVAEKAVDHLEDVYNFTIDFELQNSGAINYLTKVAVENANGIKNTTMKRVREILADELSQPKFTLKRAVERIKTELGEEIEWRAERIAQTEVLNAYNYAEVEALKYSRLVRKKKWITAKDDRVCPVCRELDGVIVRKNELFPGGFDGPGAHPNCRCSVVPVFD